MVLTAVVVAVSWPLMTACSRGADMSRYLLEGREPEEVRALGHRRFWRSWRLSGAARSGQSAIRLRGFPAALHREPRSRPQDTPPAGGRGIAKTAPSALGRPAGDGRLPANRSSWRRSLDPAWHEHLEALKRFNAWEDEQLRGLRESYADALAWMADA